MTRARVIIVDDERLARRKIRAFANAYDGLEIIAECGNVREAADALRLLEPDLVFLDVQMPGMSGLDLVRALPRHRSPAIVFVTAHAEHAVEAFDLDAVDYLLKPFDRQRFERAVRRVLQARSASVTRQDGVQLRPDRAPLERLLVPIKDRMVVVEASAVRWIAAEGKYVRLHTPAGAHLLRQSMTELERRLDPARFLRIHRSTIVNLRCIREMFRGAGDDFVVVLHDGTRLALSRRYRQRLRDFLA